MLFCGLYRTKSNDSQYTYRCENNMIIITLLRLLDLLTLWDGVAEPGKISGVSLSPVDCILKLLAP